MNQVYLSTQAINDLKDIFTALITWKKGSLELEHALRYVDDIEEQCYSINQRLHHSKSKFSCHKKIW
jgi:hypothetical protein